MKKVLFATTALIATTGMAAAEVSFGGFGRFGLLYDEGNDTTTGDDLRIEQRFRLTVTGSTTSDNGLEFEGRIRFQTDDNADGTGGVANNSAAGFAVSTGGFRLDVGHVSDVLDSGDVVDYYGFGVGLTSFAEQSSGFGNGGDNAIGDFVGGFGTGTDPVRPTVKLRYTAGDFTVSASITDDLTTETTTTDATPSALATTSTTVTATADTEYQIGFGYNFGNYSVGAAFGSADTDSSTAVTTIATNTTVTSPTVSQSNDFWAVSFGGEIGAFAFSILIADDDSGADTRYGVSAKYDVGAATEIRFAFADSGVDADDETVAIGFRHSLGGGVSLRGGIGQNTSGNTIADLGVIFNF